MIRACSTKQQISDYDKSQQWLPNQEDAHDRIHS